LHTAQPQHGPAPGPLKPTTSRRPDPQQGPIRAHPTYQVTRPHHRVVEFRTLNVRHWDLIVEAWANDDGQALDDAWINEAVVDLGSQWGQYAYVTTIGFAA
jgi:hypothetical protein